MSTTHLLYLHGFRSSPQSAKARQVGERVRKEHPGVTWWCPQLPPSPKEAMAMLMDGIASWPKASMAVVGSSLGGYYATYIAAQTGCKAAFLNPAVDPASGLAAYIGEQTAWHNPEERFFFKPEYVEELKALRAGELADPQRLFAIIAKGDELLDWKEMTARYPGAKIKLLEASDHAITDFDDHVDDLFAFLDLLPKRA